MSQAAIVIGKDNPAFFPLKASIKQFKDHWYHITNQSREANQQKRVDAVSVVLSQTLLRYGQTMAAVDGVAYSKSNDVCIVTMQEGVILRDSARRVVQQPGETE